MSIERNTGIIVNIEQLANSPFKQKLGININNSIVWVFGKDVDILLSYYVKEKLIGKTAIVSFFNINGQLRYPNLLKVEDIFYKGVINKP
jgi:hypothetical protein